MKKIIIQRPIFSFLVINYVISWSFLYPSYQMILANDGITLLSLIGLIGAYGPTIAAISVQAVIDPTKVTVLLKKLIQFKAKFSIYLSVILYPILLYVSAYSISLLYNNESLNVDLFEGLTSIPIWFLAALPFGPMGEELGWRGFMLPRLLEKHTALTSSVLVGLAWGIWHLASFTFPGAAIPSFLPINIWTIGLYCLNTISLSLFYTYIHLKSKGSVFLAIILHAFFNATANITLSFLPETSIINVEIMAYVLNIFFVAFTGLLFLKKLK